jgi:hypothetical protein
MIEDSLHGTIPNSRETEGGGVCFWETREFVTSQYAPLDNCHGAGPPSIRTNQRAAFARVCRGLGKYYVFFHPYWPHSLCSCSGLYSVSWSVLQIVRVCYARFDDHISFVQCKSASYNMGMRSNITSDTVSRSCLILILRGLSIYLRSPAYWSAARSKRCYDFWKCILFMLTYLDNVRGRGPVANILAVGTPVINMRSWGTERYSRALGVNWRILNVNIKLCNCIWGCGFYFSGLKWNPWGLWKW